MHNYNVNLQWKEGRIGNIESPQLNEKITVATPPEFEGGVPGIWSPEHLFTASVVSCFMTTFLAIAGFSKLEFTTFDCEATGVLSKVDGKFMMTEVELRPKLHLTDESKTERAQRILEKAEANCLITNSIKAKVSLMPDVVLSKPVLV
ncbi:MAG: osmotically inducible protein OsmC [Sphingobacteriaceae bacterium]|nr:osmotically inducible protein OsmC [Sphingobacteriaceae bacterium]